MPDQARGSRALLSLAATAMRGGNIGQARQMLQDHLLQSPNDADALEMLAEIAASQRSTEEATILLRRALAADPSVNRRMALIFHLQKSAPALALAEIEQLPQAIRAD